MSKIATQPHVRITFVGADEWLRENGADLCGDNVCAVVPMGEWKPGDAMPYEDTHEGSTRLCSWDDHLKALELLAVLY